MTVTLAQAAAERGAAELRAARQKSRGLIWAVGLFSVFANILMFTGPLFMLQIYDRVLGSGSEETLIALTILVIFLYGLYGILEFARGRVMARVGARLRAALDLRVFSAVLRRAALQPEAGVRAPGSLRDLEAVQRFAGSPVLLALFDLPWTPLFLFGVWIFHTWLGILALAGGLLLVLLTMANQFLTRRAGKEAQGVAEAADRMAEQIRGEAETVQSLGMRSAVFARWQGLRARALSAATMAQDRGGGVSSAIKALRLFLQSAVLALGAWLVLRGELTAGAMIASSILLGRALAPIEQAVGQWEMAQQGINGWRALGALLGQVGEEAPRVAMPRPEARLEAEGITLSPPGVQQASLRMVSFAVEPGQAMGVIGASGSGKTSLARAITGVWRPIAGRLKLGGVPLDQYEPDTLGRLIGYLPQRVALFEGTIAENIARFDPEAKDEAIVAAARRAAAHEMIVAFPEGYNTRVSATGGRLSGGQLQRIGLARALYGDPVLLVLDEPNSNLDNQGSEALNAAIKSFKAAGKSVLIMAHRPSAIKECDTLLMLEAGLRRAFGPRDDVLRETVSNHGEIKRAAPGGGGVA
jgi:ATP-binding cassette subfamily C protein